MTDLEIISRSLNDLANIKVPVELTEEIAIPLYNVSNRLKLLYNAIIENVQKQKEAAANAQVAEEVTKSESDFLNGEVPENVEQSV